MATLGVAPNNGGPVVVTSNTLARFAGHSGLHGTVRAAAHPFAQAGSYPAAADEGKRPTDVALTTQARRRISKPVACRRSDRHCTPVSSRYSAMRAEDSPKCPPVVGVFVDHFAVSADPAGYTWSRHLPPIVFAGSRLRKPMPRSLSIAPTAVSPVQAPTLTIGCVDVRGCRLTAGDLP